MGKEVIGFAPESMNKKNDKAKRPPPLKQTFVKEGEGATKEKEKNTVRGSDAKKGNAFLPNKAGDFNPSYVLCRASDGHVYAKFVGSPMSTLNGLFGFLRPLLLTSKDPLQNGYLKPSIDLL